MSLYNREGQVEFLSSREVQKLLKLYVEFDKRRQAFRQEPERYAFSLDSLIKRIRTAGDIISILPNEMNMSDGELNALERECKKVLDTEYSKR